MYRTLVVSLFVPLLAVLLGCGGTVASRTPSPTPSAPAAPGAAPASPSIVQVSAGNTAAGVNITVPAPVGTNPNAQDLGVAALTGPASAFNTGDIIHRGATMRIVVFGPGLSSDMQISILGPSDIQFGNIAGTMSTDNTPGISFTASVSPSAALGARTVVLQSPNGNVTTFTGGLEVVP